jgi:hypothetical protein
MIAFLADLNSQFRISMTAFLFSVDYDIFFYPALGWPTLKGLSQNLKNLQMDFLFASSSYTSNVFL